MLATEIHSSSPLPAPCFSHSPYTIYPTTTNVPALVWSVPAQLWCCCHFSCGWDLPSSYAVHVPSQNLFTTVAQVSYCCKLWVGLGHISHNPDYGVLQLEFRSKKSPSICINFSAINESLIFQCICNSESAWNSKTLREGKKKRERLVTRGQGGPICSHIADPSWKQYSLWWWKLLSSPHLGCTLTIRNWYEVKVFIHTRKVWIGSFMAINHSLS